VVRSWLITAVCAATVAATGALAEGGAVSAGSAASRLSPVRIFPGVRMAGDPGAGLTPNQVRAAYGLPALSDLDGTGPLQGITGRRQTIVIVDSFGSPTIAHDLRTFDKAFAVPPPPKFTVIHPAGKVPPYDGSTNRLGWAQETTLDVEWAHVMAPGASIVLVETPTSENEGTTGFPQIVTAEEYVLKHKLGQVISQSFAATEQTFPSRASLRRLRGAYQLAAKDHVTVLAATGDEGATGYKYNMADLYTTRAVSWPATDPLVAAIGGTQLDLTPSGARRSADVAWNGGGGGRSIVFGRPSYQDGVRTITGRRRGIPDISMDASCASTVSVYGSEPGTSGWVGLCGTSVATPLFAGIVALADQVAHHSLGLINPAIYKLARRHAKGIVDIRKGNNTATFSQDGKTYTVRGFAALKGYDLVSGVGTVNARYFVRELARLAG
jgi:subtilase family serine protease